MRYADVNSSLESHITTLRWMMGGLLVIIIFLLIVWYQAKNDLRIHIPPDIRSGAVLKADEITAPNVYTFASYIFQQLNHWASDGDKDYGMQIFKLSAYFTPDYREYLNNDLDLRGKKGELSGRVRVIQAIPEQGYEERRVELIDADTWVIWMDFQIQESVRGMDVKQVNIRYPIRVVRYNVDPETNPWGLALDGFAAEGPKKLSESELATSSQTKKSFIINKRACGYA